MRRHLLTLPVLLLGSLLLSLPLAADPQYTITEVGPPAGDTTSGVFQWRVINNHGQIAGVSDGATIGQATNDKAFLWQDGQTVPLPGLPGAANTAALGINDSGTVIGASGPAGIPHQHAVRWDQGVAHDLGVFPGDDFSLALANNDRGQIVGFGGLSTSFPAAARALLWDHDQVIDLGGLPGAKVSQAQNINGPGWIVGLSGPDANHFHPTLWSDGSVRDLGTFGGPLGSADGINNQGQVVGWAETATGKFHSFLWQNGWLMDLTPNSSLTSNAYAINANDEIAGAELVPGGDIHAWIWKKGDLTDLNTLVPANTGWDLRFALSINDSGQIAGYGSHNGIFRAFLLTPDNPDR